MPEGPAAFHLRRLRPQLPGTTITPEPDRHLRWRIVPQAAMGHDRRMQEDEAPVRTLAELVVDLAWFLESGDDSVVDLDDAVKQLEWISHKLSLLPAKDRSRLIALVRERAEAEPESEFREFVVTFPEAMGLHDEDG